MPQAPRMSVEEMAAKQMEERQIRLGMFPPQEGMCLFCTKPLSPLENRNYDGTTEGYCNKQCRQGRCKKLVEGGMDQMEAEKLCWSE